MDWGRTMILFVCLSVLSLSAVAQITIQPLTDQRVNQGDTVVLDCVLENLDDPDDVIIFWYHDGTAVVVNMQLAVINSNYRLDTSVFGHWKLTILQATVEDQGMWSCRVQVPNEVSQEMRLDVFAPPDITSVTEKLAPMPGATVTLWCNATGSPEPTVTWNRMRPRGNFPTGSEFISGNPLIIPDVTGEWRGLYQCFVSNGIGQAVTGTTFLQMEYAPIVRAENTLVAAPLGDPAHLKCICEAFPAVTSVNRVTWYKDNSQVDVNDGYQISIDLDRDMDPYRETSVSTLIVTSVSSDTLGMYTCLFESLLGDDDATVTLEVGKKINPDTGKSTSRASSVMAAVTTNMAAVTMAIILRQF